MSSITFYATRKQLERYALISKKLHEDQQNLFNDAFELALRIIERKIASWEKGTREPRGPKTNPEN